MKPTLVYVVTAARSIKLLDGQLAFMAQYYDVHLIASSGEQAQDIPADITFHALDMEREISIWKDMRAFVQMLRLIRRLRPAIINYGTPKASLLAGMASWFWRVPKRIYTLRGLRLETMTGKKRQLLLTIEKLISACSHQVLCISPSLLEKADELRLVKPEKLAIAGAGSSNGMNMAKFDAQQQASTLSPFREGAQVIGFVGRLTKDKGIDDLVQAFQLLTPDFPNAKLLLVGRLDADHGLTEQTITQIQNDPAITLLDYQPNIAPIYHWMDIFVFPTYREGFGNVAMEAAYSELPVITTNVTGAKDTIIPNKTGYLVPPKQPEAIRVAIAKLLRNPDLRREMGSAGRMRIVHDFQQETVWEAILQHYTGIKKEEQTCTKLSNPKQTS
ncbi:glycosyltransferase family 4 protein [Listeria booriae]|uniref:glycosyltransferase family 4 protein n=1 Tax=Listeria booriae TaxID=1552123 RepID=UPI001629B34C|nr:glycosyltransferase family 4 protein [Listeria booriae]MBC2188069.1 glycosyltransferase family 4 protein [Listeria booriae]